VLSLETDRLIIKQPEESDYQFVRSLLQSPDIMELQGGVMNEEQIQASISNMKKHWQAHGYGRCIVWFKETKEPIGTVSLKYISGDGAEDVPDIGVVILKQYRQQGYALEAARALVDYAFSELGFSHLVARTYSHNVISNKGLERLGFQKMKSEHLVYNGKDYGEADVWRLDKERYDS
jgi:ribosomal-protein-alanine N-acetyltransferase